MEFSRKMTSFVEIWFPWLELELKKWKLVFFSLCAVHSGIFDEFYYNFTFVGMSIKLVKWKKYTFFFNITLQLFEEFFLIVCEFQTIVKFVKITTVQWPAGCHQAASALQIRWWKVAKNLLVIAEEKRPLTVLIRVCLSSCLPAWPG